jgi:hypothetical protein
MPEMLRLWLMEFVGIVNSISFFDRASALILGKWPQRTTEEKRTTEIFSRIVHIILIE